MKNVEFPRRITISARENETTPQARSTNRDMTPCRANEYEVVRQASIWSHAAIRDAIVEYFCQYLRYAVEFGHWWRGHH